MKAFLDISSMKRRQCLSTSISRWTDAWRHNDSFKKLLTNVCSSGERTRSDWSPSEADEAVIEFSMTSTLSETLHTCMSKSMMPDLDAALKKWQDIETFIASPAPGWLGFQDVWPNTACFLCSRKSNLQFIRTIHHPGSATRQKWV